MINASIDELRKSQMLPEIGGIPEEVWEITNNNNDADKQILYKELVRLIIELPPTYRVVFNLYTIDGYSHTEISAMLNIPEGTSKSNLSRARMMLQKNIKELENEKICRINNELDDLLRRAVEFYPLKPCDRKWDLLSAKIKYKKYPVLFPGLWGRRKNIRISLLVGIILLIPVAMVSIIPTLNKNSDRNSRPKEALIPNPSSAKSSEKIKFIPARIHIPSRISDENIKPGETRTVKVQRFFTYYGSLTPIVPQPEFYSRGFLIILTPDIPETENNYVQVQTVRDYNPVRFGINPLYINHTQNGHLREFAGSVAKQKYLPLQHLDQPRRQGFYLGILGGPLISQVKHEGLTKSGFDFGLLVGYTFCKKFSLETGLMRAKQYYSVEEGELLNQIVDLPGAKRLDGNRDAFTIPLNMKYNAVCTSNGVFFISVGVSTFIGVNDKTKITISDRRPVPPTTKFDMGAPSYLPAYLNLSLGYEYKMGKFLSIRIEPYMEIPLKSSAGNSFKSQVGGTPIQVINSGIHIGISRFIH